MLGVDACRGGWIGILLSGPGSRPVALFAPTVSGLVTAAEQSRPDLAAVAIDIPIGLADRAPRQADLLVRAALGPRGSSLFPTPVRSALEATTHAVANATNREICGSGVSAQAYALRTKVLEVDRWRTRQDAPPCWEVHPELCFTELGGAPARWPKRTWAGSVERQQLLLGAGIVLEGGLGQAGGRAAPDDVLDAAAAAWTALRLRDGTARPTPEPPETLDDGTQCAIWV